jgi:hypothetical protein
VLNAEWLTTPIDHALPVVALLVAVIAVTLRGTNWPAAILCALPLLAGAAICFPDARHRLLAYGIIFAGAFCGALLALREPKYWQAALLTLTAIALLRWIAREKFEISREVFIAVGALAIVAVMRRGAVAIAVAVLAALLSPGIPARTALIPMMVASVLGVGSWELGVGGWRLGVGRPRRDRPSLNLPTPNSQPPTLPTLLAALATSLPLVLFPWSGAAARALPYFFRVSAPRERVPVGYALRPGEAAEIDVPHDAKSIAISLANALQLKRGAVVATLDGRRVKIGDVADWGSMRREVWWRSRNRVPRIPAGMLRGYGYDAWVDGAGSVALPPYATHVRVVADSRLPADARVQIEGFER